MAKMVRRRIVVKDPMIIELVPAKPKKENLDEKSCSHWFVPSGEKAVFCKRCGRTWPFRKR